jgi:hypothetical protein
MKWQIWLVVLLALSEAGYMIVDGLRALMIGDYLTPSSGEYAGQLGPWAHLVAAIGIEPRSALMKSIFVGFGFIWLGVIACFAAQRKWAWRTMLAFAVGSLWYLVVGTLTSMIVVGLLFVPSVRRIYSR